MGVVEDYFGIGSTERRDAADREALANIGKIGQGSYNYAGWDPSQIDELSQYERLGPYEDVTADPRLQAMQDRLADDYLADIDRGGQSAEAELAQANAEREALRAMQGTRGAIEQQMQARGTGGGGFEKAQQLLNMQGGADRMQQSALEQRAMAEQALGSKRAALAGLTGQQLGRRTGLSLANKANQSAIDRFNVGQSTAGMQARQGMYGQNIQGQNQASQFNLGRQDAAAQAQAQYQQAQADRAEAARRQGQTNFGNLISTGAKFIPGL